MREKLIGPWGPAIVCAFLSTMTVITTLAVAFNSSGKTDGGAVLFYCFMPMCFVVVGILLSQLQQENRELQSRIDKLTSASDDEREAA